METADPITRRRDPANRRIHVVELTEAGESSLGRLRAAAFAFDAQLRQNVTEDAADDQGPQASRLETVRVAPRGTVWTRRGMTSAATVISAFPAGRGDDAAALVFEYMAATQAETGQPEVAMVGQLPAVLERECGNLQAVYRLPGALLIADHRGRPAGCVGLAPCAPDAAEVKRLFVRPAFRGLGIARILMRHAHYHAAQHGMARLILDVLPTRTAVVGFYSNLGYTETEPEATRSLVGMICMERPVTSADILSAGRS